MTAMAKLTFYGHACFSLEQGDTTLLFDPFLTGNPAVERYPAELKPTVVLVTHAHGDHIGDAVRIAKDTGACLVSIPETARYAASQGVANVAAGNMGGSISFDFGFVKFVPAWHSSSLGEEHLSVGNPCGFVVKFFNHVVYHTGDTCVFGDMKIIAELTPIDVALIPIGGYYTMDIPEAVKAVELIQPKIAIPMHYGTWPVIEQDPEKFKAEVEKRTKTRCIILRPGASWDIPSSL